jgi:hypothetical protein
MKTGRIDRIKIRRREGKSKNNFPFPPFPFFAFILSILFPNPVYPVKFVPL